MAFSYGRSVRGWRVPVRHVALVVGNTVLGLTPPDGAAMATITVDARAIRWTPSGAGTDPDLPLPTRIFGTRVDTGGTLEVFGRAELLAWRGIAAQAQPATLQVTFWRLGP